MIHRLFNVSGNKTLQLLRQSMLGTQALVKDDPVYDLTTSGIAGVLGCTRRRDVEREAYGGAMSFKTQVVALCLRSERRYVETMVRVNYEHSTVSL